MGIAKKMTIFIIKLWPDIILSFSSIDKQGHRWENLSVYLGMCKMQCAFIALKGVEWGGEKSKSERGQNRAKYFLF